MLSNDIVSCDNRYERIEVCYQSGEVQILHTCLTPDRSFDETVNFFISSHLKRLVILGIIFNILPSRITIILNGIKSPSSP